LVDWRWLMKRILAISLIAIFFFTAAVCDAAQGRGQSRGQGRSQGQDDRVDRREPESNLRELKQDLSALVAKARAAEKAGNWQEAALAYLRATMLARKKGDLQNGLSYGESALRAGENAKLAELQVRAILRLAHTYSLVRQESRSVELLRRGLEIAKQIKEPARRQLLEANMTRELGYHYLSEGETQKAIDYISQALKVQETWLESLQSGAGRRAGGARPHAVANVEKMIMAALLRLGAAQRDAGQLNDATKSFERGFELMKRVGQKSGSEGKFLQEFGELYLAQKDYSRAIEFFSRVLQDSRLKLGEPLVMKAASQYGHALLESGKPLEAIGQFKRAIDSVESIRAALDSEQLRSSFVENKRRVYTGMIHAQLAAGHVEEAFDYNERARSRAFLDILGNKVVLARDQKLREEEQALQARIAGLQAQIAPADDDEESDEAPGGEEELAQDLSAAQQAYNALLAKVRKVNKEQASLMTVEPLALKQVQAVLDPETTLLEYFVSGEQIVLWVVDKGRADFVTIPLRRRDLIAKVRGLRQRISEPTRQGAGLKESAQELYRLLLAPARQHIHGKELLIVPHDVLHYVPFQALIAPGGRYLIEDYPIEYLSSASLMQFTKEKKTARRETALAFGNPNLGDEAFNLRFAEREAKEIAAVYPKSSVLLREQATKAKAISLSPNNDILHFAVHAEFNQEDPTSSALLLAREGSEDGKWTVREIFSLNLKADLVVLSACETGLGKISNGDEIVGLTRAFIYAGTPSVITTLWKVNDRASFELMKEFYLQLKTQKKSAALRQAQLKTMKEFPEPFFWAAFGLTGEP
jgi:CHAT domain-containing protein